MALLIEGSFQDAVIDPPQPGTHSKGDGNHLVIMGAKHPAPAEPSPYNGHIGTGHISRHAMHEIQHNGERRMGFHAFMDFVAVVTLRETFTKHTAVALTEEDMAVGLPPSAHLSTLYITARLLIAGALASILSLIGLTSSGYLFACSYRPFSRMDRLKPPQIGQKTPSFSSLTGHPLSQEAPLHIYATSHPLASWGRRPAKNGNRLPIWEIGK